MQEVDDLSKQLSEERDITDRVSVTAGLPGRDIFAIVAVTWVGNCEEELYKP